MFRLHQPRLILSQLVTGVMLACSLGSCLCMPKPALPPDAFEPNNTLEQAKTFVSPANANIAEGETDTFTFSASKDERVRLELTITSGEFLSFGIEVKAANGVTVASKAPNYGFGEPITNLEFLAPDAGSYVLVLKGVYNGPPDALCLQGRADYRLTQTNLGLIENPSANVTRRTSHSVTIEWLEVVGATSYTLERQTAPDVWMPIPIPASSLRAVTDENLVSDTAYVYRVKTLIAALSSTGTQLDTRTFKPYFASLFVSSNIGNQYLPTQYVKSDIVLRVQLNDSLGTSVTLERAGAPALTLAAPYSSAFAAGSLSVPEGEYTFGATVSRPGESERTNDLVVVVDRTKPTVTARTPNIGVTLVPLDSSVTLTFSEYLPVLGTNLSLEKTLTGSLVAGHFSRPGTNQIRFTPSAALEAGVSYTVRVLAGGPLPGNGSTDRAGNPPDTEAWSFTTAP